MMMEIFRIKDFLNHYHKSIEANKKVLDFYWQKTKVYIKLRCGEKYILNLQKEEHWKLNILSKSQRIKSKVLWDCKEK